jgi:secondary thiamine-phosphate synthase enzyme
MYTESIPLQSSKPREAVNIHSRVKAAVEKSGLREGVCVVCSLSSDCALVLLQPESDFRREFDGWLDQLGSDSQIQTGTFGVSFPVGLQSTLLGQQLTIPFSEGRLDVGSGEAIFFIELNGVRPRRVAVKILGE